MDRDRAIDRGHGPGSDPDPGLPGRINETLQAGEVGILFLGMLHDVTPWLASDIRVAYPLGTPVGSDGVAESET
ncbi:MAG: hypothetical protein KFB96_18055 [Thiocapsa sp.]|uniref:hypothetical protein n=1 Tax=Thiocapsa sp. TaxID=2024551 RepID=UPI001BCF231C|nr:hypothetical protein [Thiocapsa sp.]QVL47586.1 MAG: hypothetical protein KFB96_18055 [Thiocapsa sp.]